MTVIDRLRGTLVGLAVGDALGAAVEFRTPGTFEPVTGYRAGGPHGLGPGEWTDDTSMALALADSMTQTGWDLDHQAECYLAWRDEGQYSVNGRCFDIGITVSGALRAFRQTGDARTAASTDEHSSGNGSIMRLAPVPIRFAYLFPTDVERLAALAEESSLPTHASPQCLSACRYMAAICAAFINGRPREEVLAPNWEVLARLEAKAALHPAVIEIASGSYRDRQPPDIRGTGYVVHSLEAALWAFHKAASFEEAVLLAVNLGDDADTTGAVCGQIAGAYWGESGIVESLRSGLARPEMIEEALCGLLGVERPKIPEETGEDDFYMTAVSEEAVSEEAVSEEAVVLEESECTTEPPPKPASNQRTLF
jgi:ADP-ribosyl-[dinitrogen reductase] hydrolase